MRSQLSHNYKFLEGLLEWFFGPQVSLSYVYQTDNNGLPSPSVVINGEVVARGRMPADQIVAYIEELGAKRLDN